MEAEQIHEVVRKLVGPIRPVGDASIDSDRLNNLMVYTKVWYDMDSLLDELYMDFKDSPAASEKRIAEEANRIRDLVGVSNYSEQFTLNLQNQYWWTLDLLDNAIKFIKKNVQTKSAIELVERIEKEKVVTNAELEEYISNKRAQERTSVVDSFMTHCKNEGHEIPDSLYESFFGA